jgi:predicted alpha/beta hydrolase family esterase
MNFIILHGTLGNPDGNWFPWVSQQLEALGHQTIRPQLPTPEGQNLDSWINCIHTAVMQQGGPDKKTVFVAHSMAPLAVCHYLTTISGTVRSCFFVSGFAEHLPNTPEPYPSLNNPIIDRTIDWKHVRPHSEQFICFSGDNDPYVPPTVADNFADHLSAKLVSIPNGGHLNESAGYKQFPLLLDTIAVTCKP